MRTGNFHGCKTIIIENEHFLVECLAEAGPRIVRLIPAWMGENLFAETPDVTRTTLMGEFQYYGGHRLSVAPETAAQSYVPDNSGLIFEERTNGVRLRGAVDETSNIRKTMSIQLSSAGPFVLVKHALENVGTEPVRISPWAITMMRPGGVGILPQPQAMLSEVEGMHPNRHFAMWPYSRWNDRRLRLGEEFVAIKAGAPREGLKIGYFNAAGWMGYLFDDVFFVKRFGVRSDEQYPDFGCNSEAFSNHRVVELQSLGPITELAPKKSVIHTETWEVYKEKEIPKDKFGERTIRERLNSGGSGGWSIFGRLINPDNN
ncbi:MAG: hypothetical protein QM730_30990 [Anaerolineales bacterium]